MQQNGRLSSQVLTPSSPGRGDEFRISIGATERKRDLSSSETLRSWLCCFISSGTVKEFEISIGATERKLELFTSGSFEAPWCSVTEGRVDEFKISVGTSERKFNFSTSSSPGSAAAFPVAKAMNLKSPAKAAPRG